MHKLNLELRVMWNVVTSGWRGQKFEMIHGIVICAYYTDEWVFETWHKSNWWGRVGLNPLYWGIRETWRGRLTDKKWILLWAVVIGIKRGFMRERKSRILLFCQFYWYLVDQHCFSRVTPTETYGKPSFICSWLLAPLLPGINMLKGWQLNFPLWLLK